MISMAPEGTSGDKDASFLSSPSPHKRLTLNRSSGSDASPMHSIRLQQCPDIDSPDKKSPGL
jgi:hypothetical protein